MIDIDRTKLDEAIDYYENSIRAYLSEDICTLVSAAKAYRDTILKVKEVENKGLDGGSR